jgi:hypothetical protein
MDLLPAESLYSFSRSGAVKTRPDNGGEAFGPWGTTRVYQILSSIQLYIVILQPIAANLKI